MSSKNSAGKFNRITNYVCTLKCQAEFVLYEVRLFYLNLTAIKLSFA